MSWSTMIKYTVLSAYLACAATVNKTQYRLLKGKGDGVQATWYRNHRKPKATISLLLQNWHVVQLKCHVRYIASNPALLPWSNDLHVALRSQKSHHHGCRQIFAQLLASCPWAPALLPSELHCVPTLCVVWLLAVRWQSPSVPMWCHLSLADHCQWRSGILLLCLCETNRALQGKQLLAECCHQWAGAADWMW